MLCLLIMSCRRDQVNGVNDACRRTFLRKWPTVPYRFFIGGAGPAIEQDEVALPVSDAYEDLQMKQRAAYEWVSDMATHSLVAFTDTYIHIPNLMSSGFEEEDYVGLRCKHGEPHLSGGNGYILSKRAIQVLRQSPFMAGLQGDQADYHHLTQAGIVSVNDERYGTTITRHLSKSTGFYSPVWMHETHEEMTHE